MFNKEIEEYLKPYNEHTNFLGKVMAWQEAITQPPHNNPYDRGEFYTKFFNDLKQWTGLLFTLPPFTPRRVLIPDVGTAPIVAKLKTDMQGLSFAVCKLVADNKIFLLDRLVQEVILFNIEDKDFLERLSESIKKKPKEKPHARKKSDLIYLVAVLLSREPYLKAAHIDKRLQALAPLLKENAVWEPDSFRKWLKRNQKEIFALKERLKGPRNPI
jgi:hypothetical protein